MIKVRARQAKRIVRFAVQKIAGFDGLTTFAACRVFASQNEHHKIGRLVKLLLDLLLACFGLASTMKPCLQKRFVLQIVIFDQSQLACSVLAGSKIGRQS